MDVEDGDLETFPGLSAPVEIAIDDRGIPHIYANTNADLLYAAGYQMATDRLFQMDLVRRRALGRQAEVLGPGRVAQDEISRLFDFHRWGAANADRVREENPELYGWLVAWLAGVNARIAEVADGRAPLPYGFGPGELDVLPEPWTMAEHLAIAKMYAFANSNSLERELLATIVQRNFPEAWEKIELCRPGYRVSIMPPDERPTVAERAAAPSRDPSLPPIAASEAELQAAMRGLHETMAHLPRVGSNNWAVDGRHTDNGRPLVAGDPHQPLQSPSLMYTHHLVSAEGEHSFDVLGWSFVGAAGMHLGHNQYVQWTATTNFADVMDIWEVEVEGGTVRHGSDLIEIVERRERIGVAGESAREFVVREVPGRGVLLPSDIVPIPIAGPGRALLLGWTGFAATNEEQSFFGINLARSIDEYEAAVDLMEVGGFNFVAADAHDISYRVNILVPDRGDPSARPMPYTVVSGNDPGAVWHDYLPPERLPRTRAAGRGWLATANNDPWGFTFDGDVGNAPWYYGCFYAAGHRAARLDAELERLTGRGAVSVDDMQTLQTDTHSPMADMLLPVLAEALAAMPEDEALAEFRDEDDLAILAELLLEGWNRRMDREEPGALAFHLWMLFLTEGVVGDELSVLFRIVLEEEAPFVIKMPMLAVTGQYPQSEALMQEGRDWLLLRALARTAQMLDARYGGVEPNRYTWGDMHGTRFANPFGGDLDIGWVATRGGEDTVDVSSSRFFDESGVAARFDSTSGAIFRVVTTFAEDGTPQAWANFPPGNSGEPGSVHFSDTLDDWVEGRYTRLPFTRDEVEAAAVSTFTMHPDDHGTASRTFPTYP
jgi:penicillin G amidase